MPADPLVELVRMIEASVEPVEEIAHALRTSRRDELLRALDGEYVNTEAVLIDGEWVDDCDFYKFPPSREK